MDTENQNIESTQTEEAIENSQQTQPDSQENKPAEKQTQDLTEILSTKLTELITPLAARLETLEKNNSVPKQPEKKPEQPKEDKQDTKEALVKTLENRLKNLETELNKAKEEQKRRDAEAVSMRFDNTLLTALDKQPVLHKAVVIELLSNRFKNGALEKDGSFYTADGQTLQEAVDAFLTTEAGKHFLPAQSLPNGTGTPAPNKNKPGQQKITTAEALRQAFLSNF
ncbi:hypothetical protein [Floridanema aerugineum]|uniref:Uncharacterized protein n=1 Tax=Floridaenema aerugineum BLCC-F46 TaxID=3153654 RepID=A0ABV4X2C6_9CYAN